MRTSIASALRPLSLLILATALGGCLPVEVVDEPEPQPANTEATAEPAKPPAGVKQPRAAEPELPPPPPTIPKVDLTESLDATCLVRVGDTIPEGDLVDVEGKSHAIREVLGEKLTVLVFWNSEVLHSVVELEDLAREIAEPLSRRGGRIIAVNTGDTAEKAAEAAKAAGAEFLVLLDPEKAYFGKLATERLPRTYVLDGKGVILWFDLEYSRTTRRHLEQTIDVALGETPAP